VLQPHITLYKCYDMLFVIFYVIYLSYVLRYKVTKPVFTSQPNISALQVDTCHCFDCSVKEKRVSAFIFNALHY